MSIHRRIQDCLQRQSISICPLLVFQVHLQTQQEVRTRFLGMAVQVVRTNGVMALYSGLTASLSRQVYCLASFPGHSTLYALGLIPRPFCTVCSWSHSQAILHSVLLASFPGHSAQCAIGLIPRTFCTVCSWPHSQAILHSVIPRPFCTVCSWPHSQAILHSVLLASSPGHSAQCALGLIPRPFCTVSFPDHSYCWMCME